MTDVAIPLAFAGRALDLTEWVSLADSHPREFRDLVVHRYCSVLFGSLRWGILFTGSDEPN